MEDASLGYDLSWLDEETKDPSSVPFSEMETINTPASQLLLQSSDVGTIYLRLYSRCSTSRSHAWDLIFTSRKWEISDQKNDQNPHINDHFWFGDRWWLIYGLLLRDQNWSFLFWSFIACQLVINLVIYLVINLIIFESMTKYMTTLMTKLMTTWQTRIWPNLVAY